jgi:putative transposase
VHAFGCTGIRIFCPSARTILAASFAASLIDNFVALAHDPAIDRRGHDNAVMESFFSRMKNERVSRRRYRYRDEARADIFDYMERFYNPRRRHSSLGGISPMKYEKRAKLA